MNRLGVISVSVERAITLSTGPFLAATAGPQLDALAVLMRDVSRADRLALEYLGVDITLVAVLCQQLGLPTKRMREILGLPFNRSLRAGTASRRIHGSPAFAALALIQLLGAAMQVIENSTHTDARNFDTAKWLGRWIENPQPAIAGLLPSDIVSLPTGLAVLIQIVGAFESGVYL